MKKIFLTLTFAAAFAATTTTSFAQASLERITFSGGARDDNLLTATVGEAFASYAKGATNASLSIGAQPGLGQGSVSVDNELNRNVNIFPNPTDGFITVRAENGVLTDFTVSVADLAGRVLLSQPHCVNGQHIDFMPFAIGAYLVSVSTANGQLVKTFTLVKN